MKAIARVLTRANVCSELSLHINVEGRTDLAMPKTKTAAHSFLALLRPIISIAAAALFGLTVAAGTARAEPESGWQADVEVKKSAPAQAKTAKPAKANSNTTVIERNGTSSDTPGAPGSTQVKLVALLTADGQQIDQGMVWRVFQHGTGAAAKSKLVTENRDASPALKLQPGDYTINASFGRANLTRKVTVKSGSTTTEQFVLNAGGLRLNANVANNPAPDGMVTYAIYSDDRDQFANRTAVMTGAKPGLIIRLNAGIYRVVSTYGDANARVETDVTVEAGKLTEAAVAHSAAKAAFKLVTREGGEALPDTHWSIHAATGEMVKESVGALPTHMLAPGDYIVNAKSGGRVFQRKFSLREGEMANVEVMAEGQDAAVTADDINPSLEITPSLELKNP